MPGGIDIIDPDSPDYVKGNGAGRGGTDLGGGGGGGPFLGGGSGFANPFSGGASFGASGFGNQRSPMRRRMSMLGGSEINQRAPSDTVPAWLTPGEFVVNDASAQMFGPQLEQMNQYGNELKMNMGGQVPGFAYGGRVNPFDDAEGYGFGGFIKKWGPLMALAAPFALPAAGAALGLGAAGGAGAAGASGIMGEVAPGVMAQTGLAGPTMNTLSTFQKMGGLSGIGRSAAPYIGAFMDQQAQGQDEDEAQQNAALDYYMQSRAKGYAFGGQVQSPWGRMGGGMNRNPWGQQQRQPVRAPQDGGMTQGGAQNQDPFTLEGLQGGSRNGYGYDKQGFVGTYDPRNPWGHRTNVLNPGAMGDLQRQIGAYGQAGYFGPGGSPQVAQAMRDSAMNDARAYGTQAYLGADVGGMDPAAAAAYRMQAMSQAGRGVGDAMTRYRADMASREQDYARGLFGQSVDIENQQLGRQQDFTNANRLAGKKK